MDELDEKNYPGNSISKRIKEETPEEGSKKIVQVVTGKIVKKKKSWLDSFTETFLGENAGNVGSYIFYEVLVPAAKDTVFDMIRGGFEMLLYGEPRRGGSRRNRDRTYVSYSRYYDDRNRDRRSRDDRDDRIRSRARHAFEDVILDTRDDAQEVLTNLVEIIEQYDFASVADYYDLVGISGSWSDNKWGWDNLASARVERYRDGYMLSLPKPIPLND